MRPGKQESGSHAPRIPDAAAPRSLGYVMLNFRVVDLDAMLAQLRASGAAVHGDVIEEGYGRFAHASDPEGNRFELWQPLEVPEH